MAANVHPDVPATDTAQGARWYLPVVVGIILVELAWIGYVILGSLGNPAFGLDYRWHVDAAQRLLDTGSPYWPWQVSGPYEIGNGAILYPPIAFALFVPFIWLPAAAWWVIPIAITIIAMTHHRPPPWVWPVTVGLFCLEKSLNVYVFGNPTMWLVAAVAAGTVWYWPFALVILKPTFAPLMLLGIRHRSWWVALVVLAGISLLFGRVWLDWLAAARNSDVSVVYNLPTLPLVLAPLIPWLADSRHPIHQRLRP
jgi:hypothetical protein